MSGECETIFGKKNLFNVFRAGEEGKGDLESGTDFHGKASLINYGFEAWDCFCADCNAFKFLLHIIASH